MTKRIFRSIVLTAVFSVLLVSVLVTCTLYAVYESRISTALRTEAGYIAHALDQLADELTYFDGLDPESRVTLIAPDGTVLYDSDADVTALENHAHRPEVLQAIETGAGESRRYSSTLSEMTFYYAHRTASGNVLRIANTRSSTWGMLLDILPQACLMLLVVSAVSFLIARRAARQVVAPINAIDLDNPLDNDVYDEMAPLLTRMERQNMQIRQQMHDLARAHSELSTIMESMREGLVLLDRRNNVLSMNSSAARIFGVESEHPIGSALLSICRDATVLEIVSTAQEGSSSDAVLARENRTYRIFASPVIRRTKVRGVALLALDITARFAAEASRREFSANVSHELKTPLTTISGYAEIIRDGIARPADVPAFAGKIHAESKRLIALVNDILELSRLDEKQGLGDRENVPLLAMLQTLREDFLTLAEEKGLSLTLEGCEAAVEGYPMLLRELFHNLIDNAVKYTPAGGQIHVSLAVEEGRPVCRVADTGIGIPQEHQPHVFERFYRVDKSHSRQTGGTGLGLAIVKHAAEVHHAELALESTPGKGTTMTVRF